jgi:ABC-2 type transport system permease protein
MIDMLGYLRLELRRMARDRRFVFFTIAVPVGFYLLWSTTAPDDAGPQATTGLPVQLHLMVAMAAFGALGAALTTTGPRLATELRSGWLRQLRATPLPHRTVIFTKIFASMVLALPPLILVSLTAALTQDVRLSAGEWIGMIALMWVATLPFAALGTLIGSLAGGDAAQPITVGAYLALSALGGLWMPLDQLPGALRAVAHWLPSNRFAEIGWDVAGGHVPTATVGLVLAAWSVALGGCAVAAYRRATLSS